MSLQPNAQTPPLAVCPNLEFGAGATGVGANLAPTNRFRLSAVNGRAVESGDSRATRVGRCFTSHGLVLLALARARGADCTIAAISAITGLGRSTVLSVLADLRRAGMVTTQRRGRRNAYEINREAMLRPPSPSEHKVGDLLQAFFADTGKN